MLEGKKVPHSISCLPLISAKSDPAQHLSCACTTATAGASQPQAGLEITVAAL